MVGGHFPSPTASPQKRRSTLANTSASPGSNRSKRVRFGFSEDESTNTAPANSRETHEILHDVDQLPSPLSASLAEAHSPRSPAAAPILQPSQQSIGPPGVTLNFIANQFVASKTRTWTTVFNPTTQKILTRVPESTAIEIHDAVMAAEKAQKGWRLLPLSKRRKPLFRLIDIIHENESRLVDVLCREAGKTIIDARSEIARSINMIEAALSVSSTILGYHFANESTESHTINEPLGVCLAVTPFCFPFMIPMWVIPFAIATGNTLVLKPSQQAPAATTILAELFLQAQFPTGVFNVIHGGSAVVEKLLAENSIQAVSFIGSDIAGRYIFDAARVLRKRVQANCGSKNHGVIMPDANRSQTLHALVASAFGAAGQRCMGLSVAVFVGESYHWVSDLVEIAQKLVVGSGSSAGVTIGPLISRVAKKKVENAIQSAVEDGAKILLDGRDVEVPEFPDGNFIGPTIIADVQTYMNCYQNEIFGPVLVCLSVSKLAEAIEMLNDNRYGNGCSIFTTSSFHAQQFQKEVNIGRIGINVPVLATSGQISNSSNKDSFLGDINVHGFKGFEFFTRAKTVNSIWREEIRDDS